MMPRVTQRDIARAVGLSHVTVSMALRGHPALPEETKQRIRAVAEALGYVPDPMLSALASYSMRQRPLAYQANIGWINSHIHPKQMHQLDFQRYFEAGESRARELGYILEEINLSEYDYRPSRIKRALDARGIKGLLLPPAARSNTFLKLDWREFSLVRFGYSLAAPCVNTVTNSQFRTAYMTYQRLAQLGYKRIGLVLTREFNERTFWHFLGGYQAAQHSIPRASRLEPLTLPEEGASKILMRWCRSQKPDAIIGISDYYLAFMKSAGIRIPEKVGFAALNLEEHDLHISGAYQNSRDIGVAAVDLLVAMLHRGETGIPQRPLQILIDSDWRPGTTAPGPQNDSRAKSKKRH